MDTHLVFVILKLKVNSCYTNKYDCNTFGVGLLMRIYYPKRSSGTYFPVINDYKWCLQMGSLLLTISRIWYVPLMMDS